MYRPRLERPRNRIVSYRFLDFVHDALIHGGLATGVKGTEIVGARACPGNSALLGHHVTQRQNHCHTSVVTTPDPYLADHLRQLDPASVANCRAATGEQGSFAEARVIAKPDPIVPFQQELGVLLLSPLAIRDSSTRRWWDSLPQEWLSSAINARLSRLAGRSTSLFIHPEPLYGVGQSEAFCFGASQRIPQSLGWICAWSFCAFGATGHGG